MGRQTDDSAAVGSSIALLQERFRQLQKMREKREERELLKLFSVSQQNSPTKSFHQPDKMFPSRLPLQDSLSLGLNLYSKQSDFRSMRNQRSKKLWSTDAAEAVSTSYTYEKQDVDTSLRLSNI